MSTAPRRLALVITELEPGGAERMLVELATRLDRNRYEPRVFSLFPPPAENRATLITRLSEAKIATEFLSVRRSSQYFAAVRALATAFREQRMEIVQSFLFHANVVSARAAREAKVPHFLSGIRVADPRHWRLWLERFATAHADRFVCVSQSVAEYMRRRGWAADKLVVIPNGVHLAQWRDAAPADLTSLGVPAGREVLLYVGRLDAQKGLDRFFSAVPHLLSELPTFDLMLVGDGPLRVSLEKAVAARRLTERVHFLGWRCDVPSILQASSLLILPSRWEGMPNVVLEAMAAGKPVVATQSEGTVELLGLGALEQTVQVGDWQGLAKRTVALAHDPALRLALGRQNQERAAQFSLDRVAERYQRLYDSLFDRTEVTARA